MYQKISVKPVRYFVVAIVLILSLVLLLAPRAHAVTQLQDRSDQISNSNASVVATHTLSFTYTNTTTPVESVSLEFCSNSPLIGEPCTNPVGLDLTNVTLSNQTGVTGFSASINTSTDTVLLSRSVCVPVSCDPVQGASSYQLSGVVNPSSPGSYYVRLQTFSSTDGSGPDIEQGGTVFAIVPAFTVNTIVPPYLTFCSGVSIAGLNCADTTGDQINLGNLSTSRASTATSQFLAATNAQNGYSVTVDGTTMTSGNNVINSLSSPTGSRIDTSQFGINLVSNSILGVGSDPSGPGVAQPTTNYSQANLYTFNNGDAVASSPNPSDFSKFTVSYMVNVNSSQPVGVYATTIDYIALANF